MSSLPWLIDLGGKFLRNVRCVREIVPQIGVQWASGNAANPAREGALQRDKAANVIRKKRKQSGWYVFFEFRRRCFFLPCECSGTSLTTFRSRAAGTEPHSLLTEKSVARI